MPVTYTLATGGQVSNPPSVNGNTFSGALALQPYLDVDVTLPDAEGGNITFSGILVPLATTVTPQAAQLAAPIVLTGSPIASPAVPGSGTTYYALQVNLTTGAVTMLTSSTAAPTASAGCLIFFQYQVAHGDSVPWQAAAATVGPTLTDLN